MKINSFLRHPRKISTTQEFPSPFLDAYWAIHMPPMYCISIICSFHVVSRCPVATSSLQSRLFSLFPGQCQHGHIVHPAYQNTVFGLGSISTFSRPARWLNSGQTHLALTAQSYLVSDLQSHPAFLPFASPFGKFSLSWYTTRIFRA